MHEDTLRRFVEQPPAPPIIQYLRDAERVAALEMLGRRGDVLDVASEANVTRGIDAATVTRLDFSEAASDHAAAVLADDGVDAFERTDPTAPSLPFADDRFDGAVCIGPYDWRFLDVEALTAEMRRVVDPEGLFVFSTPTPRSPYYRGGKNTQRYYEPAEALGLVYPGWRLAERDLIFQYPGPIQRRVVARSERVQEFCSDVARALTDLYTRFGLWSDASYIVFGVELADFETRLEAALSALLAADGPSLAPAALRGALRWRASRDDATRDGRLTALLDGYADDAATGDVDRRDAGALLASFARAADAIDESAYLPPARDLFERVGSPAVEDVADCALLDGIAVLADVSGDADVREAASTGLWSLVERQDSDDRFRFEAGAGGVATQLLALRALARAVAATGLTGFLEDVERGLDGAVDALDDAADRTSTLPRTALVETVAAYDRAGGERDYDVPAGRAAAHVLGENELGVALPDLREGSIPGSPTGADADELGSYLAALAVLTDGETFRAPQ